MDFERPDKFYQGVVPLNFPPESQIPSWGFEYMRFRDLHKHNKGEGATAFVIDDASVWVHDDLAANMDITLCASFVKEQYTTLGEGHSAHVAGIIGAVDNKKGVIGGAPRCKLAAVQCMGKNGGSWSWVADSVMHCVESKTNAKVLNLSLGGSSYDQNLVDAIQYAIDQGCIVVVAGGNSASLPGRSTVTFPANTVGIAVSSMDELGSPSFFTSTGEEIFCSAPGDFINSTHLNQSYVRLPGSSMAAPHISALACLLATHYKGLTHEEFKSMIEDVSEVKTNELGWGVPTSNKFLPLKVNNGCMPLMDRISNLFK